MFQIGPYCLNLVSIKLSFVSVKLKEKNEMNSYHETISSFFHDGDEILHTVLYMPTLRVRYLSMKAVCPLFEVSTVAQVPRLANTKKSLSGSYLYKILFKK